MGDMAVAYAASGAAVTAVDFSEAMLDAARTRAATDKVSVEFRVGDATALDFAADSFDACRSERMLQWLPDVARGIAEIRTRRATGRTRAVWSTATGAPSRSTSTT